MRTRLRPGFWAVRHCRLGFRLPSRFVRLKWRLWAYMREKIGLARVTDNMPVERARPWWRRRVVLLCAVGWTVFVGLALWWLLRGNGDHSVWIVHEANSPAPRTIEGPHAIFRAEMGFQRVCPWMLLCPYVALVAMCFPLERGRLRLSLPLNLGACAVFIAASHAINVGTRITFASVTIIKSEALPGGRLETNLTRVERRGKALGEVLEKRMAVGFGRKRPAGDNQPGTVFGPGGDVAYGGLTNLLVQMPPGWPGVPGWSLWSSLLDLLAYGAVAGLAHAVHFYRRFRERERRALLLESSLANARLDALRAQLQPHFLFNSLNAIAALLRRDPRLAEATLMSLSELLRLALRQSERQEIALREELEFVRRYLEIQQTRFGARLRVEQDIEQAALDCAVPVLLLQPLVENAIRHGLEPDGNAGLVRLTAHRLDTRLVLTVEDDGAGFAEQAGDASDPQSKAGVSPALAKPPMEGRQAGRLPYSEVHGDEGGGGGGERCPPLGATDIARGGTGIGLANLRARLEALYGIGQALELGPRAGGGVTVRIEIPWHSVSEAKTLNAVQDP